MRRVIPCLALVCLIASGCAKSPVAARDHAGPKAPVVYQAIDLGTLGGSWTIPSAINDAGIIAGMSERADHQANGFVYQNGVMRELSIPGAGFHDRPTGPFAINGVGRIAAANQDGGDVLVWDPGSLTSRRIVIGRHPPPTRVVGMNDGGDILVHLDENPHDQRAVLVRDDAFQEIGGFGKPQGWTIAASWNARGQIVGSSHVRHVNPTYEIFHPFLWENGVMKDLGVLTSMHCGDDPQADCGDGEAVDINAYGVIVGSTTNAAGLYRITVWENGELHELDAFPDRSTAAAAINDRGQIVGYVGGADYGLLVWENGTIRRCGTIGRYNHVRGFSENGEVIGEMDIGGDLHAFVCRDGTTIDLGPGTALAINGRGDIVGTSGSRGILWVKEPITIY